MGAYGAHSVWKGGQAAGATAVRILGREPAESSHSQQWALSSVMVNALAPAALLVSMGMATAGLNAEGPIQCATAIDYLCVPTHGNL